MTKNPFDDNRLFGGRSAMVRMTPDQQGRYEFEIWSQFTRRGLDGLQVGDLVAVENYSPPDRDKRTYSVLTLTQVFPTHFATQGPDAYPGHVFESMRSIKEEWEKQLDKPLHHTTTIVAKAVSTGLQFAFDARAAELPGLDPERNLPMVGSEARPLSRDMVDAIINQGMSDNPDSPLTHRQFPDINVKLDREALLTTHFGIFGFTGVGKSNLLSSIVSTITSGARPPNIVIVDPNDEYLGLLMDQVAPKGGSFWYIHVGPDSLAQKIVNTLGKSAKDIPAEAVSLARKQLNIPRALRGKEMDAFFEGGLREALARTRIVLTQSTMDTLILEAVADQLDPRSGPPVKQAVQEAAAAWAEPYADQPVSLVSLDAAITLATQFNSPVGRVIAAANLDAAKSANANGAITRVVKHLRGLRKSLADVPDAALMSLGDIIGLLNKKDQYAVIVLTGKNVHEIKRFASLLGDELYEYRRRNAILEPFTSVILDEADLFIPLDNSDEGTKRIKETSITLARRGRKYGLGIGIATQRATLLDTEVMGNLHTYFVSKLPRKTDRERVAEAFGVGDEQLAPTFGFRPGNWLVISHDAVGLKGVPIPTAAANANSRILKAGGATLR